MIWLPGVLSQGGEKYKWKRYGLTYEEIAVGTGTKRLSIGYFLAAKSYTTNGDTFTLVNPYPTAIRSVEKDEYFITVNTSSSYDGAYSLASSGTTLYKATTNSEGSSIGVYSFNYTVFQLQLTAKGDYIDTVTSDNPHEYPDNGAQDGYWYVRVESGGSTTGVNYVGYIQSNGTQHINTEFIPNQNTRVVWEGEFSKIGNTWLFGVREALNSKAFAFFYWLANSCYTVDYGTDRDQFDTSLPVVTTVDFNKNTVTVNGSYTVTSDASTFTAPKPLFLFANNNNGTVTGMATVKTKSVKIYDNGVLVRHYKASLDPDGVACLYDEVNREYVYNAGSGTFAYGTDS